MKVALTCNTLPSDYNRESGDDTFAEFDAPSTISAIKKAKKSVMRGPPGRWSAAVWKTTRTWI